MKEIDWSKAPEGATHYDTAFDLFCNEDGYWQPHGPWVFDNEQNEWGTQRYVPRPAQWTGEGLPPVGMVCQGRLRNQLGEEDWFECKVLVHHQNFNHCAGVLSDGGRHLGWCSEFRPIRTPEQIAAEERGKAIDAIQDDLSLSPDCRYIAKRVYESGYRKQDTEK